MIRAVRGAAAVPVSGERCASKTIRGRVCSDPEVQRAGRPRLPRAVRTHAAAALVLGLAFAISTGCGGPRTDAPATDAPKTASVPSADPSGAQADNPQCKLFTAGDIAKYIGEPVSPGQNAALGTGCQWLAADGTGDVIVAVVPSSYHEPPSAAPGYRVLPEVGTKGFVAPQLDGWVAGAIVGEDAIRVSAAGATASEATTVSLLQDTIKRRAP
jgi:hypothetical protein